MDLKAQVFWISIASSTDQNQFYYLKNDTSARGLFQAEETDLTLWGYLGELDKPFIVLGDPLEHIVIRYKHHAYILYHKSKIKEFVKNFPSDTTTEVTDIIDEGKIIITYFKTDPPGIVTENPKIDTILYIKEGSITIIYRKSSFKVNIKNLVLSIEEK